MTRLRGAGRHLHSRAPVQDQEKLVAGLILAGQDRAGRRHPHLGDARDGLELAARAALQQRDLGQSRDLLVLLHAKAEERALLAAALVGLGNRAIEHATDQFHHRASSV